MVKIVPIAEGHWNIVLADSETIQWDQIRSFNPDDDLPCDDPIIPAPAGWRVIVGGCGPDEFLFEDPLYEEMIGFRLKAAGDVGAIGAQTGDMDRYCWDSRWEYAIVNPAGEVMAYEGRWPNVEAFLADKRKAYDAKVKARAAAAADTKEPV